MAFIYKRQPGVSDKTNLIGLNTRFANNYEREMMNQASKELKKVLEERKIEKTIHVEDIIVKYNEIEKKEDGFYLVKNENKSLTVFEKKDIPGYLYGFYAPKITELFSIFYEEIEIISCKIDTSSPNVPKFKQELTATVDKFAKRRPNST